MEQQPAPQGIKRRGFASMTPERRREIARNGGVKAHAIGKAHKFADAEAARAAGIKGRAKREANKAARRSKT